METFILYMAKASGLIALFILAYRIFLRKETFFTSNRWFLIAGLFTAVVLPLVTYTKVIWVEPAPQQKAQALSLQDMLSYQQALASAVPQETAINWFDVIAGVYMAGALFFLVRFILNFLSLRKVIKGQQAMKQGGITFIDTPKIESPFSFFTYIVYNSAILTPDELDNILCHERVHSRQYHSADMLLGQLFCIAFWFNPFAWMYKKSISQNLEFIADAEAMKELSDRTGYQKTLLKITVQPSCTAITNHFYQSLIKKRIIMLNKEQSRKTNAIKYSVIIPALVTFTLLFQVNTVAQKATGTAPKAKNSSTAPAAKTAVQDITYAAPATAHTGTTPIAKGQRILIYDMYGKQWYVDQPASGNNVTVIINGEKGKTGLEADQEIASVKIQKSKGLLEITTRKAEKKYTNNAAKGYYITIDTIADLTFMGLNNYSIKELKALVTEDLKELK